MFRSLSLKKFKRYMNDFSHWCTVVVGIISCQFQNDIRNGDTDPSTEGKFDPRGIMVQKRVANEWKPDDSNDHGDAIAFLHNI
jgi:hypothetical protein